MNPDISGWPSVTRKFLKSLESTEKINKNYSSAASAKVVLFTITIAVTADNHQVFVLLRGLCLMGVTFFFLVQPGKKRRKKFSGGE